MLSYRFWRGEGFLTTRYHFLGLDWIRFKAFNYADRGSRLEEGEGEWGKGMGTGRGKGIRMLVATGQIMEDPWVGTSLGVYGGG